MEPDYSDEIRVYEYTYDDWRADQDAAEHDARELEFVGPPAPYVPNPDVPF